MSTIAISYFKKAALDYSKGDILELINKRIDCAGPLLSVTVNGIDLMGGICFGFNQGSSFRSIEFMKKYMNIKDALAELLYSCVRCGVAHQGMPKIGLKFFVRYDRLLEGTIIYKDNVDNYLFLNVTEFAYSYIAAIDKIDKEVEKHVHYYPELKDYEKTLFTNASITVKNDIMDFCGAISEKHTSEERTKFERGEIKEISSLAAYTPENSIAISIELSPESFLS